MADMIDGLQQLVYFHKDDTFALLEGIERLHRVRYFVYTLYEQSELRTYDRYADLGLDFALGTSRWGAPFDLVLEIQFPPFVPIPMKAHPKGFTPDSLKSGSVSFWPGGIYDRTGELVSGSLAFCLLAKDGDSVLRFEDRLWGYDLLIGTAKQQGARRYRDYLIGPHAWNLFEDGVPLVHIAGTRTRLE